MVVLFVFLKGIRSPIIVGVAIPYSVIVTFVLMYFAGFSLNIMTLGALALGIGMLVDNSIVVIENIERHLGLGKNPKEASLHWYKRSYWSNYCFYFNDNSCICSRHFFIWVNRANFY